MPGDPSTKASSGGIIAYNHDSARGWNDPPTFAFANNTTANKPKLDLRKRVSHQQALHGNQAPAHPQRTCSTGNRDDVVNGVAGMNLNGSMQPLYTPPPVMTTPIPAAFTRSTSTPSFSSETVNTSVTTTQMPPRLQTPSQGPVHARSTDCLSGNLGQPLFDLKNHSFEPVRTAHSIRSNAVIGDRLDHEDSHIEPQIFHPIAPSITAAPSVPSYQAQPQPIPPVGHATPPPPFGCRAMPPLYPAQCQSPIQAIIPTQGNGVLTGNQPLPGQSMTPPPPPGNHISHAGSLSAGSTPRSVSPFSQETSGDTSSAVDDNTGLKITMNALQDVINKLQDTLEKRVADDIARRLQVMSQNWTNGKLSQGVKSRMIRLAKALDDGDAEEAHRIHISLMVDFVAEVNQWMVAVKKLINLVQASNAIPTHS